MTYKETFLENIPKAQAQTIIERNPRVTFADFVKDRGVKELYSMREILDWLWG